MKKTIVLTLVAAFGLMSCNTETKTQTTTEETSEVIQEEVAQTEDSDFQLNDGHDARNSLDYLGTYEGVLPCADCEGIETTITLNEDETYQMKTVYLKDGRNEFDNSGNWSWKDSSTITLKDGDSEPEYYFVAENKIIRLDMEGNRITGDLAENYELHKTN